ncbi:hypothetical protein M885DRAFT_163460 [Pelagophyceae sp. CCMP2097]|nr:hypothetical protein M885DRAFT_163460 [Pelagophyceae sp. CCMP2097]
MTRTKVKTAVALKEGRFGGAIDADSIVSRLAGATGDDGERWALEDARGLLQRKEKSGDVSALAQRLAQLLLRPPRSCSAGWVGAALAAARACDAAASSDFRNALAASAPTALEGADAAGALVLLEGCAHLECVRDVLLKRGDFKTIAFASAVAGLDDEALRRRALNVSAWLLATFDAQGDALRGAICDRVSSKSISRLDELALAARAIQAGETQAAFLRPVALRIIFVSRQAVPGWALSGCLAECGDDAARLALLRAVVHGCDASTLFADIEGRAVVDFALEAVLPCALAQDSETRLAAHAVVEEVAAKLRKSILKNADSKALTVSARVSARLVDAALWQWRQASPRLLFAAAAKTFEAALALAGEGPVALAGQGPDDVSDWPAATLWAGVGPQVSQLPLRSRLAAVEALWTQAPTRAFMLKRPDGSWAFDEDFQWRGILEALGLGKDSGVKRAAAALAVALVLRAKKDAAVDRLDVAARHVVLSLRGDDSTRRFNAVDRLVPALKNTGLLTKERVDSAIRDVFNVKDEHLSEHLGASEVRVLCGAGPLCLEDLVRASTSPDDLTRSLALDAVDDLARLTMASTDEIDVALRKRFSGMLRDALCDAGCARRAALIGRRLGGRVAKSRKTRQLNGEKEDKLWRDGLGRVDVETRFATELVHMALSHLAAHVGTDAQAERAGVDFLDGIVSALGPASAPGAARGLVVSEPLRVHLDVLLRCLESPWDRTRSFAFGLLRSAPLKELLDAEKQQDLAKRAAWLVQRPSLRRADAGAKLVALCYHQSFAEVLGAAPGDLVDALCGRLEKEANPADLRALLEVVSISRAFSDDAESADAVRKRCADVLELAVRGAAEVLAAPKVDDGPDFPEEEEEHEDDDAPGAEAVPLKWQTRERVAWHIFKAASECVTCLASHFQEDSATDLGEALLGALLRIRHSGAIAAAQAALHALAKGPSMATLREKWLAACAIVASTDDDQCTLRRSAGLASAVVALAQASLDAASAAGASANVATAPYAVSCALLLQTARDPAAPHRAKAKSLNTLSAILDRAPRVADKVSSDSTDGAVCLTAAVAAVGLALIDDSAWTLRTAATLSLAAVVRRVVDHASELCDGSATFDKFAGLEAALAPALKLGGNARYFVLVALARLNLCPEAFQVSILDCGASKLFAVRHAAAAVAAHAQDAPRLFTAAAAKLDDAILASDWNAAHGALLASASLLGASHAPENVVDSLADAASKLISDSSRPPLVRLAAQAVLARILENDAAPPGRVECTEMNGRAARIDAVLLAAEAAAWPSEGAGLAAGAVVAGESFRAAALCAAHARRLLRSGRIAEGLAPLCNEAVDDDVAVAVFGAASAYCDSALATMPRFDGDDDFGHDLEDTDDDAAPTARRRDEFAAWPAHISELESLVLGAMRALTASVTLDADVARRSPRRLAASLTLALRATLLSRKQARLVGAELGEAAAIAVSSLAAPRCAVGCWPPPVAAAALPLAAFWSPASALPQLAARVAHFADEAHGPSTQALHRGAARAAAVAARHDVFDARNGAASDETLLLAALKLASSVDGPTSAAASRALCPRGCRLSPRAAIRAALAVHPQLADRAESALALP